jgi:hypothetical protein
MFRSTDLVSFVVQQPRQALANTRLVVNNKDSVLRCVAHDQARPFVLVAQRYWTTAEGLLCRLRGIPNTPTHASAG